MEHLPEQPDQSSSGRPAKEYDDPHYHDDVEIEQPANDDVPGGPRPAASKKTIRRILTRRRYPED